MLDVLLWGHDASCRDSRLRWVRDGVAVKMQQLQKPPSSTCMLNLPNHPGFSSSLPLPAGLSIPFASIVDALCPPTSEAPRPDPAPAPGSGVPLLLPSGVPRLTPKNPITPPSLLSSLARSSRRRSNAARYRSYPSLKPFSTRPEKMSSPRGLEVGGIVDWTLVMLPLRAWRAGGEEGMTRGREKREERAEGRRRFRYMLRVRRDLFEWVM